MRLANAMLEDHADLRLRHRLARVERSASGAACAGRLELRAGQAERILRMGGVEAVSTRRGRAARLATRR